MASKKKLVIFGRKATFEQKQARAFWGVKLVARSFPRLRREHRVQSMWNTLDLVADSHALQQHGQQDR